MNSFSLVKFLRFLRKGDKTLFDVPKAEQETYIATLPEPKSDIQRSLNQFKCQSFFWPKWKVPVFNIAALFAFFPILIVEWVRGLFLKPGPHFDALSELKGMEEVVPREVSETYDIRYADWLVKGMIRSSDLGFVLKVFFNTFPHCYCSLKVMLRVAQYSQMLFMYTPRAIITHEEFSFASSALTSYCERRGMKHINVMHGEKLYHIYDSFFRFSECYVWSEHYKQLFISMRAEKGQFRVSVPPSMKIDSEAHQNPAVYADYKYYLAKFTADEIARIVAAMNHFKEQGATVKYRVHPRYLNLDIITRFVPESDIEDPRKVSIQESVANCHYAVGSYSTVLAQAYVSGKSVILDNVNYKEQFDKLAEYNYWLASEDCARLSDKM